MRRDGTPIAFTPSTSFVDAGLAPGTTYAYDVTALDTLRQRLGAGHGVGATTVDNPFLVKSGDAWSYRADGVDLGTAWRQPGFDTLGLGHRPVPARLGQPRRGHRRPERPDHPVLRAPLHRRRPERRPAARAAAEAGRRRRRVPQRHRDRRAATCPAGTLTADTYPSSTATRRRRAPRGGSSPHPRRCSSAGDNVLAVELHQDSRSDTHAVFDAELELADAGRAEPADASGRHARPAARTRRSALQWTASTDDAGIAGYVVRRNGDARSASPPRRSLTDTGLSAQTPYGYEVTAVDTSGNASTPGLLAASTTGSVALHVVRRRLVVPLQRRRPGHGVAPARLRRLVVGLGPVPARLGRSRRDHRRSRAARSPSTTSATSWRPTRRRVDALVLRVKRDDGIAVYVNGTEVVRDNLPAGTLTAGTYPTVKVTAADGVAWKQFTIPTSVLVNGDNTIAAEVHQDSRSDTPRGLRPHARRDGQQLRSGGDGVVARHRAARSKTLARHAQGPLHQRRRPGGGHGRRHAAPAALQRRA